MIFIYINKKIYTILINKFDLMQPIDWDSHLVQEAHALKWQDELRIPILNPQQKQKKKKSIQIGSVWF